MARTPKRSRKTPVKKRKVSSTGRKRAKSKKRRGKRAVRRWPARLLALGFLLSLVAGVYLLYLDHTVRLKFEGRRWAVPARVYSRPLELYPGADITPTQLVAELDRLGYRKVRHPKQQATWSRNKGRFLVRTRPFAFWDAREPGRYLDLRFQGGAAGQYPGCQRPGTGAGSAGAAGDRQYLPRSQ